MGGGFYSSTARTNSGATATFKSAPVDDTFKQNRKREVHVAMDSRGITLRDSRDSEEHPNSVPIIIGLDVTASMSYVPAKLIGDGLPNMMDGIIDAGVPDPQVLFLGIGDHECDSYPLQVGQFESSDELMDKWLTSVYLESGGGGNRGESYHLAWMFAGNYTQHDAWEKRKKKGYLFTIGDEPCLAGLSAVDQKQVMGEGQYSNMTANDALQAAQEYYEVYHFHILETGAGARYKDDTNLPLHGTDNLIKVQSWKDIPAAIASIVAKGEDSVDADEPHVSQDNPSLSNGNSSTEML